MGKSNGWSNHLKKSTFSQFVSEKCSVHLINKDKLIIIIIGHNEQGQLMSLVFIGSTSGRLPVSCRLSTYSYMLLWLKLFIRNNKLHFLDEVISGRIVGNNLVKGSKQSYLSVCDKPLKNINIVCTKAI